MIETPTSDARSINIDKIGRIVIDGLKIFIETAGKLVEINDTLSGKELALIASNFIKNENTRMDVLKIIDIVYKSENFIKGLQGTTDLESFFANIDPEDLGTIIALLSGSENKEADIEKAKKILDIARNSYYFIQNPESFDKLLLSILKPSKTITIECPEGEYIRFDQALAKLDMQIPSSNVVAAIFPLSPNSNNQPAMVQIDHNLAKNHAVLDLSTIQQITHETMVPRQLKLLSPVSLNGLYLGGAISPEETQKRNSYFYDLMLQSLNDSIAKSTKPEMTHILENEVLPSFLEFRTSTQNLPVADTSSSYLIALLNSDDAIKASKDITALFRTKNLTFALINAKTTAPTSKTHTHSKTIIHNYEEKPQLCARLEVTTADSKNKPIFLTPQQTEELFALALKENNGNPLNYSDVSSTPWNDLSDAKKASRLLGEMFLQSKHHKPATTEDNKAPFLNDTYQACKELLKTHYEVDIKKVAHINFISPPVHTRTTPGKEGLDFTFHSTIEYEGAFDTSKVKLKEQIFMWKDDNAQPAANTESFIKSHTALRGGTYNTFYAALGNKAYVYDIKLPHLTYKPISQYLPEDTSAVMVFDTNPDNGSAHFAKRLPNNIADIVPSNDVIILERKDLSTLSIGGLAKTNTALTPETLYVVPILKAAAGQKQSVYGTSLRFNVQVLAH